MRVLTAEEIWCAAHDGAAQANTDVKLVELLQQGVHSMTSGVALRPQLRQEWSALLAGGLPGLRAAAAGAGWVQFGLAPAAGRRRELYGAIAGLVGELESAGALDDFFFLHKHPGMRVRLQARDGCLRSVRHTAECAVSRWMDDGLVGRIEHGVYEPEYLLFGGPVSMRSVHGLFTADSRVWLQAHAEGDGAGPPWATALLLTRSLLSAVRVSGWERLDVADRLRRQAGRGASDELLGRPAVAEVLARMRGAWANPDLVRSLLSPTTRAAVDAFTETAHEHGTRWHADYFTTREATVGPREAATFVLVFQWNRAGLSMPLQHLLAAVLAERPGGAS